MHKMTFEFNEELHTILAKAAGITIQVTETEEEYSKYMVVSSTGIRKVIYSSYDLKSTSQNDIEIWLATAAIDYFEMKHARLRKLEEEKAAELPETSTELPF